MPHRQLQHALLEFLPLRLCIFLRVPCVCFSWWLFTETDPMGCITMFSPPLRCSDFFGSLFPSTLLCKAKSNPHLPVPGIFGTRGLVTWYIGYWELGSKYIGNWKIRVRFLGWKFHFKRMPCTHCRILGEGLVTGIPIFSFKKACNSSSYG